MGEEGYVFTRGTRHHRQGSTGPDDRTGTGDTNYKMTTIKSRLLRANLVQLSLLHVALNSVNEIFHQYQILTTPRAEAKIQYALIDWAESRLQVNWSKCRPWENTRSTAVDVAK